MGFTLGQKEFIINGSAQIPLTVKADGEINIKGYGTFDKSQLIGALGQRFVAEDLSAIVFIAPSASDLGLDPAAVNVPVSLKITTSSSRMGAEWGNNYIINSRPFIVEVLLSGGDGETEVATKLKTALDTYASVFGDIPFNYDQIDYASYATSPTGDAIWLEVKESHLTISPDIVFNSPFTLAPFRPSGTSTFYTTTVGSPVTVTAVAGDVITVSDASGFIVGDKLKIGPAPHVYTYITAISGSDLTLVAGAGAGVAVDDIVLKRTVGRESTVDGKYLEESVRMSLPATSDLYGIDAAQRPVLKGKYAQVTLTFKDDWETGGVDTKYKMHAGLGGTRDETAGQRNHTFTLYLLEGSDVWGTDNALDDILTNVDVTPFITNFKLSDGSTAASIDEFVS